MSKQSGLGDNFYVGGYDLSGDIGKITVKGGPAPLPVTGIDKFAFERRGGVRDGAMEYTAWFNPSTNQAHDRLSNLPTANQVATYLRGTALAGPVASIVGKQINYDGTRGEDGSYTLDVSTLGAAYALEWGIQLTSGRDTLGGAGAGTGVDYGAAVGTTAFGLQAYLHVFAFAGTSATVAIQMSSDNGGGDPYADVAGGVFTAASGITAERIQTSRTESIERWLRVNVTGTFSNLDFAVMVEKNRTAVLF